MMSASGAWPLPERFCIRLTMLSDWHVGSGTGRPGNIDRLVLRDHDGLPYVPAKTLRGLWRDACERLCWGLDHGHVGGWSTLVDRLFGSQPSLGTHDPAGRHADPAAEPIASAFHVRPAHIPSPLREKLRAADRRLRQALTVIKPGVAIDARSGSAKTDFLKFEEMARGGTVLEAECRLHVPDSLREAASALLTASAKLVERLGGKRRRGAGRCQLEILQVDDSHALRWLREHAAAPAWPEDHAQQPVIAAASQPAPTERGWVVVPLKLTLRSPLAVAWRVTGNVVQTLDHLPGYYLLPHVTRVFPMLRGAVPAGEIAVLPAYPEVAAQRGEPVPLALFEPKGSRGSRELQHAVNRLLATHSPSGEQLKQIREGYLAPAQPSEYVKTPKIMLTHNSVFDAAQRPSEETGGVYSYEAIGPQVVLRSELWVQHDWAERLASGDPQWHIRLDGTVALGRSKKDDYGEVALEAEAPREPTPSVESDRRLYVWLTSDTLLRNERLRLEPTPEILGRELSRRLGVALRLCSSTVGGPLDALVRVRRLEAWHGGWGLPRPWLVALQAGSCVVFEVQEDALDPERLRQLEASGIGERRAEGFGRLRFNHPLVAQPQRNLAGTSTAARRTVSAPPPAEPLSPQAAGFAYARLIERHCWEQEIHCASLAIAANAEQRQPLLKWTATSRQGQPPMSQHGALRGQLARLRTANDVAAVLDWLEHLRGNPRRSGKWPDESLDRIEDLLRNRHEMWERILTTDSWPTITQDAAQTLREELWPLAMHSFFGACIRAHKRELEHRLLEPLNNSSCYDLAGVLRLYST